MPYFDNAATTKFKPLEVVRATVNAVKNLSYNASRASHRESLLAAELVHNTRSRLKSFFDCKQTAEAVFTLNCTAALNLAILGSVRKGGHIITTSLEHNSVLRPLHELAKRKLITLSIVPPNSDGIVSPQAIAATIEKDSYMVVLTHISNVTGSENPIRDIGAICQKRGLTFVVDAAQSAGLVDISMQKSFINMLCVAPHKGLHSIQGLGVLLVDAATSLKPLYFGGTGTDSLSLFQPKELPESLEAGTLPLVAIAALNTALDWVEKNKKKVRDKIYSLTDYIAGELKKMPQIKLFSNHIRQNSIVSFSHSEFNSTELVDILSNEYGFALRGGLHCAPLAHKHLKTLDGGLCRISAGFDNTIDEVDRLLEVIVSM